MSLDYDVMMNIRQDIGNIYIQKFTKSTSIWIKG